jgi:hypothetical protein
MEEGQTMSDAIDPRIQNLISAVENYTLAGGADNRNWIAESVVDLERQLLTPDHVAVSREDASEYLQMLEGEQMEMNPFAWVGSKQELQDRIDRLRAALSANGSALATSPEAAAECPEASE